MSNVKRTYDEKLENLDERIAQLQEQKRKVKAQKSQEERKKRTRALIEVGAVVYSIIGEDFSYEEKDIEKLKSLTANYLKTGNAVYSVLNDEYRDGDIEKLTDFLQGQNDRGNYFSSAMDRNNNQ